MNLTHIAAGQLAISSSTDHASGDQAAPPVIPGAGGVTDHREKGLLQDVSDRASSFRREQSFQVTVMTTSNKSKYSFNSKATSFLRMF